MSSLIQGNPRPTLGGTTSKTSLKSGQGLPGASSALSAEGICAIIEACSKNRVTSLTYGVLSIEFGTPEPEIGGNLFAGVDGVDQLNRGETRYAGGERGHDVASLFAASPEERELTEEIRLAQLMTDNPLAYEQEMIDQNLNPRGANVSGEDSRRA